MIGAGRIVRLLGVLLAAGALAQPAWAEGGLPGSPQAIGQVPSDAVPSPGGDATATAAQASSLGGAVFNPFAKAAAMPTAARQPAAARPTAPEGPSYTLGLFVALACAAAVGWLTWRAVG
ncbi:hypothetical protein C7T35_26970 [Variovorax sp. WS11]|nr:hypothetical protein C7T35_26970 [Variovorax sp. WS11]